jgi:hypothetical protein
MALTDDSGNGMVMPVAPMYGGNGGFGGGFGDDWGWIILLLLVAGNGWDGFGGFGGGMGAMAADGAMLYPWMNQANLTSEGFQNQLMNDNITSIRDGIANLSTQLCNCCGDMQMALANGFAGVEQGANTRQMANMQQNFANQTAMMQGFNNIQSQFADCCCENRLANCQTQNIIQNEGNTTRFADANNTRDIIQSQTQGTQAILDKLCQLELDGYKRENDALRTQLTQAQVNERFASQNALMQQGFSDEVDALYNRLSNCPVPSTPVYGRTPIFTCNNSGCGCGCNGNF